VFDFSMVDVANSTYVWDIDSKEGRALPIGTHLVLTPKPGHSSVPTSKHYKPNVTALYIGQIDHFAPVLREGWCPAVGVKPTRRESVPHRSNRVCYFLRIRRKGIHWQKRTLRSPTRNKIFKGYPRFTGIIKQVDKANSATEQITGASCRSRKV
jgi:hypothetical protein